MDPTNPVYVADGCALLWLAQDEPGSDEVATILSDASTGSCRVLLHQMNFGELVYQIGKRFGWVRAERKGYEILMLPSEIIFCSDGLFWEAAELKAAHRLSFTDCFVAALAMREGATLLTSDPEYEALGDALKKKQI